MHFFDLPQELLEAILAQASRGSLASLARVCQRLRPLAERILYQSVYLRNHDGEKFTYALDCVPARAEYVRELIVHYHYVDVEDEEEYYPLYAETLSPTIGRLVNLRTLVIKGLEFDADREEDDEIIGGYERVIAEAEKWDTLFAQSAVPGSQILPSLTKCMMIMDDIAPNQPAWDFSLRGAVLMHPCLQDLTIVGGEIESLKNHVPSPRSTPLERLSLFGCDVSPSAMGEMLSLPRALKHLTYKGAPWCYRPTNLMPNRQIYVDKIKAQADSLLSLDIDFYPGVVDNPPVDFTALQCLEQLTVESDALRGTGEYDPKNNSKLCLWKSPELKCQLPPSLKHLVLFLYCPKNPPDWRTLIILYNWISRGSLPNLEKVTFQIAKPCGQEILDRSIGGNEMSIGQAFGEVKVQLQFELVPNSNNDGYELFDCPECGVNWRNMHA
ncbi:hypothetical protein CBS147482_9037 [Aspergillus niger]|nr:hypothetical protein CBS147482_9037 [Aspergillus niger]